MGKVRRLPAFIILIFISLLLYPTFIGAATYTYDALNRLIRVHYDNGTSVQYFYDEVGNRIQVGGIENVVISASAGSNGSISPSGAVRVVKDGSQTFKIIPKTNYAVFDVQVDGVPVETTNSYTFSNVTTNHTISASFLPAVSAITINPNLIGGYIYEGKVTLGAAAPSGGAIVSLSSSNPAVASVPTTVTIAEGATSAVFALNVVAVRSDIELNISASYGKTSQTASLSILSPIITSFALASKITGGSVTQGTITLDGIAPEGGAVVSLSSSNPAVASVPATVTIAAGATSATFDVITTAMSSTTSVTISASYDGETLPVSLLVTEAGIDANTVLMLHMDGADNSTVFIDSEIQGIPKTVTSNGAVITTAQFESGGASGRFNGAAYLTTPSSPDWNFGTGDFTIDTWVYTTDITKVQRIFTAGDNRPGNVMYTLGFGEHAYWLGATPTLNLYIYTGSHENFLFAPINMQNNTWNHIAVVRKGTSIMGFFNGKKVITNTISASLALTPSVGYPAQIGFRYNQGSPIEYVNGYLDELRVSKGVARWTDDFMPSTYFSILPVNSVSFDPGSVTGGSTTQGTVTLRAAAPESGAIISLSSSNSAIASVPATVTVAAGATSATFDVTTAAVGSTTTVTISASYDGGTLPVSLLVTEAGIDANTVLMLHMDGADNSTVFTDSEIQGIPKILTANGATISTAHSVSGGASGRITGTSYLTVPDSPDWDFGTGDFTIDTWVYTTDITKVHRIFTSGNDSGGVMFSFGFGEHVYWYGATPTLNLYVYRGSPGSYENYLSAPVSMQSNTWNHVAVVRKGTAIMGFLNGKRVITNTISASVAFTPAAGYPAQIGFRYDHGNPVESIDGYLDELRVSKGIARWTDDFTPPATAYVSILPVSSLTFEPASVIGGSTTQGTVTLREAAPVGGAVVSLSSNNPAVATVLDTVTVAAGATSATFSVITSAVGSTTTVTISASYEGGTLSSPLLLTEAGIDSYTKLLLHMDGPEGSIVFTDSEIQGVPKTVTSNGAVITTAQFESGGASGRFNGASYLTTPSSPDWNFGTGDFTIDTWVYTTDITKVQRIFTAGDNRPGNVMYTLGFGEHAYWLGATPTLNLYLYTGSHENFLLAPINMQNNTWNHIAVVRKGTTMMGFFNGKKVITNPISASLAFTPTAGYPAQIGFRYQQGAPIEYVNGYLDEMRVSKGIARWTSDFTPPTSAYFSSLQVKSVTFDPAIVTGGGTIQGTITLDGIASAGGAVVSLNSSNPAVASVPATVTVAPGSTNAVFTVDVAVVSSNSSVTISANYGGRTETFSLMVLPSYTVTAGAGSNGSITPSGVTMVNGGGSLSYTVSPDSGYHIDAITGCGGTLSGSTYTTGQITGDCTVMANFAINTYAVTPHAEANGGISPNTVQTINHNSMATFTVTPNTGYHIDSVSGCDGTLSGSTYTTGAITGDCSVTASFAIITYEITASSGVNGNITPSSATVNHGSSQVFTITPNTGYHIVDVLADGSSVGAVGSHTFSNVTTAHAISATFAINTYTITANSGANGNVTCTPLKVNYSSNSTCTIAPDAGHHIIDVTVDGASIGAVNNYTFSSVTADHTISVAFAINTYALTASAGLNGTITPASSTVNYNSSQTFTITPDIGFHVSDVLVDGTSAGALTTYTFNDITADHTISASFEINIYSVIPTAGIGGSISPNVNQTVNHGSTTAFIVTPNVGHHIVSVSGCDGTLTGNTYTTGPVMADCTVTANFAINSYMVTAISGGNGSVNPDAQIINHGSTASVTVTPDTGHHIVSVTGCNGTLSGNTYMTGPGTGDCTVSATFAINTYTVTPLAGANGGMIPAVPLIADYNTTLAFTIMPATGYHVTTVIGCGGILSGNTYTTGQIIGDCAVDASFAINTYTVTPSAGANGSMSPSTPQTVNYNNTQAFTVTPGAGYHIEAVSGCGGTLNGSIYTTGAVIVDCSVSATFSINTYTVSMSAGAHGSIACTTATVNHGSSSTCTTTPDEGYHIVDVSVNGASVGTVSIYTISNVTADTTIEASFAINTYSISANTEANGSITCTPSTVDYGASSTCAITTDTGYHVADVLVDGASIGAVATYTFNNVTSDHTINVKFAINTYIVTPSAGANGTVSCMPTTINHGSSSACIITPDTGYHIDLATGCGGTLSGSIYTTGPITSDCTVSSAFAINTYTITVHMGSNGTISCNPVVATHGSNSSCAIVPGIGYHIIDVLVDGRSVGAITDYTFSNVTADCTISASFAINTYLLSVSKSGTGSGTVNSALTGINCGTDCSEVYEHGTEVALTAIADAGSTFVGWSGACQGTAACIATMESSRSVSATFADITPPKVTINATPDMLGPSDHKLRTVSIGGSAVDNESGIASVVVTVSDEYGKYNMTVPGFGSTIQLEAWREGADKDGRRYTITAVVTDKAGNKATASTLVVVPHDMSGKKYDEDEDKDKHHDDYDKKDDGKDHHNNDPDKDKNYRDRHDEKADKKNGKEPGDGRNDKSNKKKDSKKIGL